MPEDDLWAVVSKWHDNDDEGGDEEKLRNVEGCFGRDGKREEDRYLSQLEKSGLEVRSRVMVGWELQVEIEEELER